jgi:hypothetical protein
MKLLAFVACEKVIVDTTGNASLIVILQGMNVAQATNEPVPHNAVGPKDWALIALWRPSLDEVGKTYDQMFEIFLPDGSSFAKPVLQFSTPNTKTATNTIAMNAIPMGQPGTLIIKAWVEYQGSIISEVADHFIDITHGLPPAQGAKV